MMKSWAKTIADCTSSAQPLFPRQPATPRRPTLGGGPSAPARQATAQGVPFDATFQNNMLGTYYPCAYPAAVSKAFACVGSYAYGSKGRVKSYVGGIIPPPASHSPGSPLR